MPVKKNGISGILYLTSAPKFVLAIPTPKANINEKIMANKTKGSFIIVVTKLNGLVLTMRVKVTIIKIKFSITEIIIIGLPISQGSGLYRAVKIAVGAIAIIPEIDPSIVPIL